MRRRHKNAKKQEYFQNIFLKISKYCHIDAYFFQLAKQYEGKNMFLKNSLYEKNRKNFKIFFENQRILLIFKKYLKVPKINLYRNSLHVVNFA